MFTVVVGLSDVHSCRRVERLVADKASTDARARAAEANLAELKQVFLFNSEEGLCTLSLNFLVNASIHSKGVLVSRCRQVGGRGAARGGDHWPSTSTGAAPGA